MKRDIVSAHVHMWRDTPLSVGSCTHFGWLPPPQFGWSPTSSELRTYLIDGSFLNQNNI